MHINIVNNTTTPSTVWRLLDRNHSIDAIAWLTALPRRTVEAYAQVRPLAGATLAYDRDAPIPIDTRAPVDVLPAEIPPTPEALASFGPVMFETLTRWLEFSISNRDVPPDLSLRTMILVERIKRRAEGR